VVYGKIHADPLYRSGQDEPDTLPIVRQYS
jgi:hypothetical protein